MDFAFSSAVCYKNQYEIITAQGAQLDCPSKFQNPYQNKSNITISMRDRSRVRCGVRAVFQNNHGSRTRLQNIALRSSRQMRLYCLPGAKRYTRNGLNVVF